MIRQDESPFANARVTRKPNPPAPQPASEKQVRFLTALLRGSAASSADAVLAQAATIIDRDKILAAVGGRAAWIENTVQEEVEKNSTKDRASAAIDSLLRANVKPMWDPVSDKPTTPEIDEDGFFFDPTTDPVTIYKVQKAVHGSGKLYAKVLIPPTQLGDKGTWEYVGRGPLRKPLERLTLEKAKELGHLYGCCMVCGATLTNETSIAAGIGPVCGGRLG